MTDLDQLLTPGAPIFDPENMTRELLFSRLTSLLARSYVDTLALEEIRALTLDLSGAKKDDQRHRMPQKVQRLSCIDYVHLSKVNRQDALDTVMDYVGLTHQNGPELLGVTRWHEVQSLIDTKVAGQSKVTPLFQATQEPEAETLSQEATPVAREWSQKAVALKVLDLLEESTCIGLYDIDRTRAAVNELRALHGMPAIGKSARDAGFQALGTMPLKGMDPATHDSIPAAILDALALDTRSGPQIFGDSIWAEIVARFARGMTTGGRASKKASMADLHPDGSPTFWEWLRSTVMGKR